MCILDVLRDESLRSYIKVTFHKKLKDILMLSSFENLSLNERGLIDPWQKMKVGPISTPEFQDKENCDQ